MTTWREAVGAREQRQRRQRRHYTPDLLGRRCAECGLRLPLALLEVGENAHPTCGPLARALMLRAGGS